MGTPLFCKVQVWAGYLANYRILITNIAIYFVFMVGISSKNTLI